MTRTALPRRSGAAAPGPAQREAPPQSGRGALQSGRGADGRTGRGPAVTAMVRAGRSPAGLHRTIGGTPKGRAGAPPEVMCAPARWAASPHRRPSPPAAMAAPHGTAPGRRAPAAGRNRPGGHRVPKNPVPPPGRGREAQVRSFR
ncbi:hypothetical protein GCM10009605_21830 [Nocardiopsis composta]